MSSLLVISFQQIACMQSKSIVAGLFNYRHCRQDPIAFAGKTLELTVVQGKTYPGANCL